MLPLHFLVLMVSVLLVFSFLLFPGQISSVTLVISNMYFTRGAKEVPKGSQRRAKEEPKGSQREAKGEPKGRQRGRQKQSRRLSKNEGKA